LAPRQATRNTQTPVVRYLIQAVSTVNIHPKYHGTPRQPKTTEKLIDAMYVCGDLDALLQAVFDHVRTLYRSAAYNNGRGHNDHLASIVADEIARSLPSYSGPSPLAPYDPQRAPLSHLVNLKARTKHLNELRNMSTVKRRLTVLANDVRSDEHGDSLTYLSDRRQSQRRGLYEQERALAIGSDGYPWRLRAGTLRVCVLPTRTGWHYDRIN
jgi:hypothetical protein